MLSWISCDTAQNAQQQYSIASRFCTLYFAALLLLRHGEYRFGVRFCASQSCSRETLLEYGGTRVTQLDDVAASSREEHDAPKSVTTPQRAAMNRAKRLFPLFPPPPLYT